MKAPFQIERIKLVEKTTLEEKGYFYRLVDTRENVWKIKQEMFSRSPIAPKKLRDMQARLNTRALLD